VDAAAFSEIDDAVATAEDGDRITVRSGLYMKPVVVDRAVEIVGEGDRAAIVLEPAEAEALAICASGATIRNLTIRPASIGNDGSLYSAVWVRDVAALIEDCDLTSRVGATVWVGGPSSRAVIRRCRIHDGAQNGVGAWDEGTAIVEATEITGHRWPAVIAQGAHASIEVRDCRIVENRDIGAVADAEATLIVERTLFLRNGRAGVAMLAATPICRIDANDFEENGEAAIFSTTRVGGRIRGNRLRRNRTGIMLVEGASPEVDRNEIVDSDGPGIFVGGAGTDPTITDNLISSRRGAGIVVTDGAAGRFKRNRISARNEPGISVGGEGTWPTFSENVVTGAGVGAIELADDAGGTFERNELHGLVAGAWSPRVTAERDGASFSEISQARPAGYKDYLN